jgi:signal transduction histidine kinase
VRGFLTRHFVGLICTALISMTALAAALVIWDMRQRTTAIYQREATTLGTVLAEETTRYVQAIDNVLQELQARNEIIAPQTVAEFDDRFGTPEMHDFLQQRMQNLPPQDAFMLVDAEGREIASSRAPLTPSLDLANSDYLQYFRRHDDQSLFVDTTRPTRPVGLPMIYLARRINGPDHRFLGVVVAALDATQLSTFHRAANTQPGQTVTLLRRDGLVLSRVPDLTHEVGRVMPATSPWHQKVREHGGSYRSPGYFGQSTTLVSVNPLLPYPLVVDVSVQEYIALAGWRQQAWMILLATAGAVVAFLSLAQVVVLQFRRQAAQNAVLRQTATALRASEQREAEKSAILAATLEHMDQGIMMVDSDRRVAICNRRAMELLDLPMALMAGRPLFEDVLAYQWAHEEFSGSDEAFRSFVRCALLMEGPTVYERRRPNGKVLEVRTTALPNGEAVRTYTDVTERHNAHEELARATDDAVAANRAKSEFLANMSHEFRTPLNAILGFSELIRDQPRGPHAEYAKDINDSGRNLLEMVNDLLDMSKLESGRYDPVDEPLNLGNLIRRVERLLARTAQENEVRIVSDPALEDVTLTADRRAIHRAMLNVLSNAVKFTLRGGVVTVRGEAEADGGFALLVADTGVGIAADAVPALFEPFRQADASISRRFSGAGLGLAISRKLLTLHGARLELASQPGEGTVVRILFPASRVVVEQTVRG